MLVAVMGELIPMFPPLVMMGDGFFRPCEDDGASDADTDISLPLFGVTGDHGMLSFAGGAGGLSIGTSMIA